MSAVTCDYGQRPFLYQRHKNEVLVSLVFIDIVDSTKLSQSIDSYKLMDFLVSYYLMCSAHLESQGGTTIRYIGDAVVGLFEYSERRTPAVKNVINAACNIKRDFRNTFGVYAKDTLESLGIRISIATGKVVRAEIILGQGKCQEVVFGRLPFIAARMNSSAAPYDVVMCNHTSELCKSFLSLDYSGEHYFKGFDQPIGVWKLLDKETVLKIV